jgi:hypothetical protein
MFFHIAREIVQEILDRNSLARAGARVAVFSLQNQFSNEAKYSCSEIRVPKGHLLDLSKL